MSGLWNRVGCVDEDYEGDEYALLAEPQDGPGLFDDALPPVEQDGPDLFGEVDDASPPAEPETVDQPPAPEPVAAPAASVSAPAEERNPNSSAPLALYRRYRPDTFAEVIGQEHVTVPLQRALDNNRVNHAYLFSGPRGCGKTTSARILARCLNCEQGPTSTPCGECRSCRDLARGGPGSIDVIEIDAASHGGVDDARDLRERAFFAPVHSRYKIYIVDEAHMVTTAGFNALLKLVEEPPPHAKFVFATTEPDKVIGTIRSRTHHYPFRLVPPRVLGDYLTQICEAEEVRVDPAAIPLVVRAGGGSVRDSMSVLDQLLGGSGPDGIEYEQAAALLGYTPDALLDDIMDAFAAGDAAAVFHTIDRVIEVGQDPRRFAEDLLRRLRDLVILSAVPEAAENGMLEVSGDQAQRLATQVAGMGAGELTRAAEVVAAGLTDMRGTTAPRLHLELMCARVLLPGADTDERGLHARIDRLERRVGMMGDGEPTARPTDESRPSPSEAPPLAAAPRPQTPTAPQASTRTEAPTSPESPARAPQEAPNPPAQETTKQRPAGAPPAGRASTQPQAEPTPARPSPRAGTPAMSAVELRRVWPEVLDEVRRRRRFTYMTLSQNAQVLDVSDGQLLLGFANPGAKEHFASSGSLDILVDSLIEVIGVELRVQSVVTNQSERQEQRPAQRPAGEPPAQPASSATPPSPPERHEPDQEIGEEDEAIVDPDAAAVGLLANAFGAEVIDVEDQTRTD